MTDLTPTPYTPPDGVILTTVAEARRIGHGEMAMTMYDTVDVGVEWWQVGESSWPHDAVVWWRTTPEPTVTIELPESVAQFVMSWDRPLNGPGATLKDACRDAIARLDGDT